MRLLTIATMVAGIVLGAELSGKMRFDNYRLYRILPFTPEQVNVLHELERHEHELDFWSNIRTVNHSVDVMVPPHKIPKFLHTLERFRMKPTVLNENVQRLIDAESTSNINYLSRSAYRDIMFQDYYDLDVIYEYLYKLEKRNPELVQVIVGGKSYEGRNITGAKLSYKAGNKAMFIEAGIHAREWIAPSTALFILNELLISEDSAVRNIAENYDWYIFPTFNPDGYEFSRKTNRMWRKTRQPYGNCYGADGNRNWGYHWNEGGASANPCLDTYAGEKAFSEIESQSMSEYITSISSKLLGYISFHSYAQLLLIPYGYTSEHLDNFDDMLTIGNAAATSLKKRYGTQYTVGNIVETIKIASGSSIDWVKGVEKVPLTYTYEFRPPAGEGLDGFILPPEQIIPNGAEVLDSIITMLEEANKMGY